jgi:hypothetical protein
MNAKN